MPRGPVVNSAAILRPMIGIKANLRRALAPSESFSAIVFTLAILAVGFGLYAGDPGYFWHDDFQTQHIGGSREIARAWSEGSFPLLARWSWAAGALAGEFQYGVFSIFLTVLNILVWKFTLTLDSVAAILAITHLTVTALGAYLLSREFGISRPLAAMVGFISAYNGFHLGWDAVSWYPGLTSFAWLPWFWLFTRRAVVGRVSFGTVFGIAFLPLSADYGGVAVHDSHGAARCVLATADRVGSEAAARIFLGLRRNDGGCPALRAGAADAGRVPPRH